MVLPMHINSLLYIY